MKIEEGTKCARCEHPATLNVTESTMDFIHGLYEQLCNCCALARWIATAETAARSLAHWRRQEGKPCQEMDVTAPAPE